MRCRASVTHGESPAESPVVTSSQRARPAAAGPCPPPSPARRSHPRTAASPRRRRSRQPVSGGEGRREAGAGVEKRAGGTGRGRGVRGWGGSARGAQDVGGLGQAAASRGRRTPAWRSWRPGWAAPPCRWSCANTRVGWGHRVRRLRATHTAKWQRPNALPAAQPAAPCPCPPQPHEILLQPSPPSLLCPRFPSPRPRPPPPFSLPSPPNAGSPVERNLRGALAALLPHGAHHLDQRLHLGDLLGVYARARPRGLGAAGGVLAWGPGVVGRRGGGGGGAEVGAGWGWRGAPGVESESAQHVITPRMTARSAAASRVSTPSSDRLVRGPGCKAAGGVRVGSGCAPHPSAGPGTLGCRPQVSRRSPCTPPSLRAEGGKGGTTAVAGRPLHAGGRQRG